MKNNKSVLVIGGLGFIGKNIAEYFSMEGFDVSVVGRHIPEKPYDIVINCAAKIHAPLKDLIDSNIDSAIFYALSYYRLNNKVRYLHLGSSSEYGDIKIYNENNKCKPDSDYAVSKLLATNSLLSEAFPNEFIINIVRPFTIYGNGELSTKFLPTLHRAWKNNTPIRLYSGSHDWTYIKDFCNLCKLIIESPYNKHIFNAGTGISTSNYQVVQIVEKITKNKFSIIEDDTLYRSYDKNYWASCNKKVEEFFGWKPQVSLEEGLYEIFK